MPVSAVQWQRDNLANGVFIDLSGAVNPTYVPTVADVGCRFRVRVTDNTGASFLTQISNVVGPVSAAPTIAATEMLGTIPI